MKGQGFLEAILTGFLISLSSFLFVEYFGVMDLGKFGPFVAGLFVVNFILLLFIGVPGKLYGTSVVLVILLVLGYAAYGPYAEYLRGPMDDISEGMETAPGTIEHQIHCLSLLTTDPMSYQTECVAPDQRRAEEENPEDYGFEMLDFRTSTGDIYASMPLQAQTNFENKGDYNAENVLIKVTGGEYRECETEVFNLTGEKIKKLYTIGPEETYNFRFKGKINDPWSKDVDCGYAKNKASIGGKINLEYAYDYQTESYIDKLRAIRNTEETDPRFDINSAREKAAPGNVLMLTFGPLIWSEESFQDSNIQVGFKNERVNGDVIFRGESEKAIVIMNEIWNKEKWCEEFCKGVLEPGCNEENTSGCTNDVEKVKSIYSYCEITPIGETINKEEEFCNKAVVGFTKKEDGTYSDCKAGEPIDVSNETECNESENGTPIYNSVGYEACLNKSTDLEIDVDGQAQCNESSANSMYEVKGKYTGYPDKITIYIVGEKGKEFVDLACGEDESEFVDCSDIDEEDKVELKRKKGRYELGSGEKQFLYSGVELSLTGFPTNLNIKEINFGVKSDATYRVKMIESKELTIHNPHYFD